LSGKNNELGGAESTTQLIIVVLGHHKDVPLTQLAPDENRSKNNYFLITNKSMIYNLGAKKYFFHSQLIN